MLYTSTENNFRRQFFKNTNKLKTTQCDSYLHIISVPNNTDVAGAAIISKVYVKCCM